MWEVVTSATASVGQVGLLTTSQEGSPLSSASSGSGSSSASPPAASVGSNNNNQGHYRRKPSKNFPGLVKRSHMGSLASIVNNNMQNSRQAGYTRSASAANAAAPRSRRPSSLHLPVTQTLSASAAIVSPILSVAARAIHNNNFEAGLAGLSHCGLPGPFGGTPQFFPAAEFAPGNHLHQHQQSRAEISSSASNNAKGETMLTIMMQI